MSRRNATARENVIDDALCNDDAERIMTILQHCDIYIVYWNYYAVFKDHHQLQHCDNDEALRRNTMRIRNEKQRQEGF